MGCGCKKTSKREENKDGGAATPPRPNPIHYVYCPLCKIMRAMRLSEDDLASYRCETCQTITVYFRYPPSTNKLLMISQQRGFSNDAVSGN